MNVKKVVEVNSLCKEFDGKVVLNHLNLTVGQGDIYGILGINGAGKTTLLKLVAGLLEPTEGSVRVMGYRSWQERNKVLGSIGSLIEIPVFYDHLSAEANLSVHLAYMDQKAEIGKVLTRVGLGEAGDKPVGKFSLGMRQRLGIARSLIHHPMVLLLDEPVNGLDPVAIRGMRELFRALKEEGVTVLLSSHMLGEVIQTVERVAVISQGSLTLEADISSLQAEYEKNLEDYLIAKMNGGKK